MMIKTLQKPVYKRQKRGLPGAGLRRLGISESPYLGKTFEDYLMEMFHGEVVFDGGRFSSTLSDMMKKNLEKI